MLHNLCFLSNVHAVDVPSNKLLRLEKECLTWTFQFVFVGAAVDVRSKKLLHLGMQCLAWTIQFVFVGADK